MKQSPTFVPPYGSLSAKIAFVGEQPGRMEVQDRVPFTGPSGRELMNDLAANNIARSECYFTNVIKDLDAPIANYIKLLPKKQDAIVSEKGKEYISMLAEELAACDANVIVPVGNIALYALALRFGIMKWRGSIIESTLLPGRKLIPIIHPATVIPPKGVFTNKTLIITDIARIYAESKSPIINEHPCKIVLEPDFETIINYLIMCKEKGLNNCPIALDIEVIGPEITCISFAYDEYNAISIPFVDSRGDYMLIQQEIAVWKLIAEIIENPNIELLGQNIIFDLSFIFRKYGIVPNGKINCTMVAQKILYPDLKVGLDFITSIYTRLPYYKADGKEWMKVGGKYRTFWNYNAFDSLACAIALPKQIEDLTEQGNIEVFNTKMDIIRPLMYMTEKGIKVDTTGLLQERDKTKQRILEIEQKIWDEVGYQINYNSPTQLKEYFYGESGIKHKPYHKRNANGVFVVTTDEMALKRLARDKVIVATYMLEIRGLAKRLGTYLNLDKLSADSRVRCQYKPHGTKTGRLSSSEDIFGEGLNQQNWPHDLLSYLTPDDGYIFYSFDLSQIENRIVANVSRCISMLEAFDNNIDLHLLTSGLVFNKPWDQISSEAGSSSLGDGKHSERDWGKKCNHSLNYDLGYKSFALRFEMKETEAKWIVERYHSIYPEIRTVYHKMVQNQLAEDRTLTNLYGRKRVFLDRWGDQLFKDAYAHIPQSTVADKMDNEAINYIWGHPTKFAGLQLLIQIHDSLGFQLPLSIPWTEHARMLLAIHSSMCTPLVWHDREFIVPTDLTLGYTLNKHECEEIKHRNIPYNIEKFAKMLKETSDRLKETN